ncbi:Plasmodium vivax Vir protein, putative [Plasmodium vivax]|nr:Plasmodium vivax Vir protein, putative [Plasmodium vivax]
MDYFLGDEQLRILPTKLHYYSLDHPLWADCEDELFYNEAKKELSSKIELGDVSDNILKTLCYVYRKSSKEDFDDNICNFLYFWLGDILLKKLRVKEFYSEIILELFKILKNNTRQVCTARYPYMHKDDFEKFKLIFDISEDYKIYKSQIYKIVPELEKSQEEQGTGEAQEKLQEDLEIGGLGTTLTQPNSGVKASTEERASTSRPYLNTIMTEIPGTSATTDNPSPSIASKSITGAVSVAGILVPSYLMYNYTYAGTWINKVLGRKTRTNFNPYTDQYLMANISGPENFYSERSRYNISYRPE